MTPENEALYAKLLAEAREGLSRWEPTLRELKDTIPPGADAPRREWNDIYRDGVRAGIDKAIAALRVQACPACEVGLIGDGPDTQRVCPACDGTGCAEAEPFWHAVVSDKAPVINRAIRRADAAEEYAQNCRGLGYPGVEVVPLYRRAKTP